MSDVKMDMKLLKQWHEAKDALDNAQALERKLRDQIVATYFADKEKGTHRITLGQGKDLKVEKKETVKIIAEEKNLAKLNERFPNVFKKKYDFSVTGYKALTEKEVKFVNQFIETKDGAPTLSIVTAKV